MRLNHQAWLDAISLCINNYESARTSSEVNFATRLFRQFSANHGGFRRHYAYSKAMGALKNLLLNASSLNQDGITIANTALTLLLENRSWNNSSTAEEKRHFRQNLCEMNVEAKIACLSQLLVKNTSGNFVGYTMHTGNALLHFMTFLNIKGEHPEPVSADDRISVVSLNTMTGSVATTASTKPSMPNLLERIALEEECLRYFGRDFVVDLSTTDDFRKQLVALLETPDRKMMPREADELNCFVTAAFIDPLADKLYSHKELARQLKDLSDTKDLTRNQHSRLKKFCYAGICLLEYIKRNKPDFEGQPFENSQFLRATLR